MSGGSRERPGRRAARSPKDILRHWGPAVFIMAVIFVASSLPNLTRLPGGISDKTGHFAGYALLGGLVLRALARSRWQGVTRWAALQAWGICLVYGASDELHQWFVPGRSTAFDDWLADAAGAAFAVTVVRLVAGAIGRGRDRTV